MLEPTVIVVSTLTFDEPWTPVTIFLTKSGKWVSLKELSYFRKSCNLLLLSLTILEFPLLSFISVMGTKEQLDTFSMVSITSAHNGLENANKFLCTLVNPLPLVNPPSDLRSRISVCSVPWSIEILPQHLKLVLLRMWFPSIHCLKRFG